MNFINSVLKLGGNDRGGLGKSIEKLYIEENDDAKRVIE
jgi:hypothetical protein